MIVVLYTSSQDKSHHGTGTHIKRKESESRTQMIILSFVYVTQTLSSLLHTHKVSYGNFHSVRTCMISRETCIFTSHLRRGECVLCQECVPLPMSRPNPDSWLLLLPSIAQWLHSLRLPTQILCGFVRSCFVLGFSFPSLPWALRFVSHDLALYAYG